MAEKEKPKPLDYDSMIDDLIKKIDNEKSLFTLTDGFHDHGSTLLVMGLLIFFTFLINLLPESIASTGQTISISIAILALLITYVSITFRNIENNIVEANFGKVIKKFKIDEKEREKRFLLEGLLKIKAIAPNYELEVAKKMHPEMFTKEKLLEKLYD